MMRYAQMDYNILKGNVQTIGLQKKSLLAGWDAIAAGEIIFECPIESIERIKFNFMNIINSDHIAYQLYMHVLV